MSKVIYLDHNATTPLHPEVRKVMADALDCYGNPSSMHTIGRQSKAMIESARDTIANFIGASSDEIVFVGSGSEANNTVLSKCACPSCLHHCTACDRKEVITTEIEHPCVLETAKCLLDFGAKVTYLGVDHHGVVSQDDLGSALSEKTKLVSIMMANNEIGTIQDIKKLAHIAHKQGAMFHTDAVQAVGKVPVDVVDLNVDFLTISGHKIYGPKGIGALYVKKGTPFCPLIKGGHQEDGRRAGTENVLGIIGLGKAIEMRAKEMKEEGVRLLALKQRLRSGLQSNISDIRLNGHPDQSLSGTLNVSFYGAEGEAILLYLDIAGIAVSTGSACASGSLDPSHVLTASHVPIEAAHGSVRFSLGRETTEAEIDFTIQTVTEVIEKIRKMSTMY